MATKTTKQQQGPKRGRPPIGDRAMTPAERKAAQRERQWEATKAASLNPEGSSKAALMSGLSLLLDVLDRPDRSDVHADARRVAGRAIRELCTRYRIKPPSSR